MTVQRSSGRPGGGGRRAQGDGGAALVEFALVLPFLAILVFGTVDLGRAYQLRNRLTNAAREGGFYGQFHPCDDAGVAAATGLEDPTITSEPGYVVVSTVSGCPSNPTGELKVSASADMDILTPLVSAITGPEVTVTGEITVAVQG